MSGITESPPTYYFSGITFNPNFYSSGDYLTKTTAKKYFLSYPTAQGTETVSTLYASTIDSPNSAVFNFLESQKEYINIGETINGTAGQIIQIGAPTKTTVQCGFFKANRIDAITPASAFNILESTSGDIKIGKTNAGTAGQIIQIGALTQTTVKCNNLNVNKLDSITGTTAFNLLESQTADINFGNLTSTTVNCNSLKSNKLDSITGTTDFNLLESQTANINIGNTTTALSTQVIKIGDTVSTTVQCNHLKANKLSSQSQTTAFDLLKNHTANINIGETTTGTSGQVIQIGPSTLTNICLGELEIIGSSINNSVNPSLRSVSIGTSQTNVGAELNLGTNAGRGGPINIGTGNTTANPEINIGAGGAGTSIRAGATINIGKLTTNPITIGNASANVVINSSSGSIKTSALTLTNPITLPTTAVTPTSAQLGYYTTGGVGFTTVSYTAAFPSGTALGSISSIPIGR